jgi:hypothetical protein
MSRKKRSLPLRKAAVQAELDLPPPPGFEAADGSELELAWWQKPATVIALAAGVAVLLVVSIVSQVSAYRDRKLAAVLENEVKTLTLRASTQDRTLRIAPNPRSWSASPDAAIRWPEPPELLDIYLPVVHSEFKSFAVTVDKVDMGRVLLVHRMVPDSNRDLRLSLNSSAFGPGEYRIRLQGYTWRGQRVDAGWVRLVVLSNSTGTGQ